MAHGRIPFSHGTLAAAELVAIFSAIPADVTFVDADGIIRYFSEYRIFDRPESCLDTDVLDCHTDSRPGVAQLLSEFRDGWRDEAIFAEQKDGRPVHVRYLAVRDAEDVYLGCVEIVQWADEIGMTA